VVLPSKPDTPIVWATDLAAMHDNSPAPFHPSHKDDPAYIVFTSGTSGSPRAVVHAHRAVWARRMMRDGWYGLRSDDRLMHAGAFNWTYTLGTGVLDPWAIGATALIAEHGVTPAQLPLLLKRHDATVFAAAPGVYRQMLKSPIPALPKLRHGLSAGEKLPDSVRAAWREAAGGEIYEAFGMSECSTFISTAPQDHVSGATLGRPQTGRHVAIVGPEGPVAWNTEGTIAMHQDDPGLMLGYLDQAEETRVRRQGPWFLTGDRGTMAPDGLVEYLGRDDDMMNAGGYRVSPLEVEAAFAGMPGLTDCAAIEVAVRDDVHVIGLFYTADNPLDETALQDWGAKRLARYKQPRLFCELDTLPRSANGKLLRRALARAQTE